MIELSRRIQQNEIGATSVEYGLLIGLIAIVIVGAVAVFGTAVTGLFELIPPALWP